MDVLKKPLLPSQGLLLGLIYAVRQRQCCENASDPALIENNEVAGYRGCNPFWRDSIVFNQSVIVSVVASLTL